MPALAGRLLWGHEAGGSQDLARHRQVRVVVQPACQAKVGDPRLTATVDEDVRGSGLKRAKKTLLVGSPRFQVKPETRIFPWESIVRASALVQTVSSNSLFKPVPLGPNSLSDFPSGVKRATRDIRRELSLDDGAGERAALPEAAEARADWDPVDEAILNEVWEELLNRLSRHEAEIFLLHMQGLSKAAIASRRGCSERTVERALQAVRVQLERMLGG